MVTVLRSKLQGPLQVVNRGLKPGDDFRPVINLAGFADGLTDEHRNNTVLIINDGNRCPVDIWMSAGGR